MYNYLHVVLIEITKNVNNIFKENKTIIKNIAKSFCTKLCTSLKCIKQAKSFNVYTVYNLHNFYMNTYFYEKKVLK